MQKMRRLSTIAMILMAPMLIYYPYEAVSWQLELSFLDPGKWARNNSWVDSDAQIATTTRWVFFLVWFIPTVLGALAYSTGFSILWLTRQGRVFDRVVAKRVTLMGTLIFLSSGGAVLAGSLSPMIRSWHNAGGPLPLRFWYNTGNLGMMFCGLAFVFLGIAMQEAIRIARENEAFV